MINLEDLNAVINYRMRWFNIEGKLREFPELHFVDMGPYGNERYFEHFRQWADNEGGRQKREAMMKEGKGNASILHPRKPLAMG